MKPKIIIILIAIIALLSVIVFFLYKSKSETITSYDQCVAAGNPVQESFPEICKTKDGQSFVNPTQGLK